MAKYTNVFSLKTFCLVTGASKGLGQSIAVRFAKEFPEGSVFVLLARSKEGLEKTKHKILNIAPDAEVFYAAVDLGDKDEKYFSEFLNGVLAQNSIDTSTFQQSLIVHNAGSLGDVSKKMSQHNNMTELQKYWDLNLSSVVVLNSVFIDLFRDVKTCRIHVVNVSSISALQPFKSWSVYCAGKAARDMFFRTMAEEEEDIRVLNYAPGPLDTDMQLQARTLTGDVGLKTMFADMKEGQKLLTSDQSTDKLTTLLKENKYESGAHIDYYD